MFVIWLPFTGSLIVGNLYTLSGPPLFPLCKKRVLSPPVLQGCFEDSVKWRESEAVGTMPGTWSVQSLSRVWLFATPWTAACQASLSITNSQSLPKPMSIELVMPSNHLILYCPLDSLPLLNTSQHQGIFQWVSQLFASGGQNIGVSTLASVLPMNT